MDAMETKWLEDFLSMAETLSFSKSARLRHVTQPAFSRRIQALENWLGAELIDRTSYPAKLTPAGQAFLVHAREMLEYSTYSRSVLRGKTTDFQAMITFAMPHTLSMMFFPKWLTEVERRAGKIPIKVEAGNTHDVVMQLVEGNCDILMCYHHPYQSIELDNERYEMLVIGKEPLRPYSKAGAEGVPLHCLPGTVEKPVPFLSYAPNTAFARTVEKFISEDGRPVYLSRRCEGDLALALKMMAVHGHGVAWLPQSAVADDVESGALALALDPSSPNRPDGQDIAWSGSMEIRIYRDRESRRALVDRVWNHLVRIYSPERN